MTVAVVSMQGTVVQQGQVVRDSIMNADSTAYIYWEYNAARDTLTISGTGAIPDFASRTAAPWLTPRDSVDGYADSQGSYPYLRRLPRVVVFGEGITRLGQYSFASTSAHFDTCHTVILPNTLTEIGSYCFYSGVPRNIEYIHLTDQRATDDQRILLPAGLKTIESNCFTMFSNFNVNSDGYFGYFEMPDSLESVQSGFFRYAEITSLRIKEAFCKAYCGTENGGLNISSSSYIFNGCANLRHILIEGTTMPYVNVTSISSYAPFVYDLAALATVYVEESMVSTYESDTFWGNFTIKTLDEYDPSADTEGSQEEVDLYRGDLGDNLTWEMLDVSSGSDSTSFELYIYRKEGAESGEMIDFEEGGGKVPWYENFRSGGQWTINIDAVTVEDDVTSIGAWAFYLLDTDSYYFSENLTTIGSGAFTSVSATSLNFSNTALKTIGSGAFQMAYSLATVRLPSTLDSIANWAFSDCPLTSITIAAETPPALGGTGVFGSTAATCNVPCAKTYCDNESWSSYNLTFVSTGDGNDCDCTGVDTSLGETSLSGKLVVRGLDVYLSLEANTQVSVYTIDGRLLLQTTEQQFTLPAAGAYLLVAGGETAKIVAQ